ncbi:MAG: hypothetical protein RLZZ301_1654 [Bacteroidota bacterium]|jgi:hypothetical protein
MKSLYLICCFVLLAACHLDKALQNETNSVSPISIPVRLDAELATTASATLTIDSVLLEGTTLRIQYSGFAANGALCLAGSPSLAKSFPPIRACKLVVLAKTPDGQSLTKCPSQGTLEINVSALSARFEKDAPTYLQLEGWAEKLLLIYPDNGRAN